MTKVHLFSSLRGPLEQLRLTVRIVTPKQAVEKFWDFAPPPPLGSHDDPEKIARVLEDMARFIRVNSSPSIPLPSSEPPR